MKREQSPVRLGATGPSGLILSQGEERCIHHGIHRITSTLALDMLAKILILPSIVTGQKCSQAAVPLRFHNLNP